MVKNLKVYNSTSFKIKKNEIHKFVNSLKKELKFSISDFSINFINEPEMISLNKKFLSHNYSTDIITFNYSGENYTLDGEIFISLDDASYNAQKYGADISNEILRLIIHGFLHMLGFDDKNASRRKEMKRIEDKLVDKYLNFLTKLD